MLFNSGQFFVFFVVVFFLYWIIPSLRVRNLILLVASVYFYISWNAYLALVIVVTTAIDYLLALRMEGASEESSKKFCLLVSICMNLGLLCYFKYLGFFARTFEPLIQVVAGPVTLPNLDIILPIGISFYTFEAINYSMDVYRGYTKAERNLGHFLLFITFFPHLVAGPIVRARSFLPQIRRKKRFCWIRFELGVQYFVMGLFKKLALADRMALLADPIFAEPTRFSSWAVLIGVLAYTIQIYCDFSGYTDMAIGLAHMLDFRLAQNFNMPYSSVNISEFWRRWHISLSSWLRDYLYIPMGGNRGRELQIYRNLMMTMLIGGLWHGANWTFVAWGGLHGLYLVVYRGWGGWRKKMQKDVFIHPWLDLLLSWILTQAAVVFAWILFRAPDFSTAQNVYSKLFLLQSGADLPIDASSFFVTLLVVAAATWVGRRQLWSAWADRLPAALIGPCYAVVFILAILLAPDFGQPFIYFQF